MAETPPSGDRQGASSTAFGEDDDSPAIPAVPSAPSSRDKKLLSRRHRERRPSSASPPRIDPVQHREQHRHHTPHHSRGHDSQHFHSFPYAASSSIADLALLADLVDERSGWCEHLRMSDEQIEEQCQGKSRSVARDLREFYEKQNYIIDGWRAADIVVDSQFPAEVMRRFGTVEEVTKAWDRTAALNRARGFGARDVPLSHRQSPHPHRTTSHTHIMHLLSSSTNHLDGYASPRYSRSPPHSAMSSDEERGHDRGSTSRPFTPTSSKPSGGIWRIGSFWSAGGGGDSSLETPPARAAVDPRASHRKPTSGKASKKASRDISEEESGFDSDSEPEPIEAGPGRTRKAPTNDGERRSLLRGRSEGILSQQEAGGPDYGTVGSSSRLLELAAKNRNNVVVRDVSPQTKKPVAVENEGPQRTDDEGSLDRALAEARERAKEGVRAVKAQTVGHNSPVDGDVEADAGKISPEAASESEETDVLTALPGGKRERERLALRKAIPGYEEQEEGAEKEAQFAININLVINVLLLAGKAIAVLSSSSVSLLASLVDSALDLLSTLIIFVASKAVAFKSSESYFKYPRGKKNFEPLGVVIFSVLMVASFCQVLLESVQRLSNVLRFGKDPNSEKSDLPLLGIVFMLATIAVKLVMWLRYRRSDSAGVRAVAQDSQNDVIFNLFSLTFPFLGSWLRAPALDPLGGIVLSLYIISEWLGTLVETVTKLSGARASPEDLARVLYLITRFKSVRTVSSCEMYYAGEYFTVEADIIFPWGTPLKSAHDLGEIVNYCVETLPNVERAFIHLDVRPFGPPAHFGPRG